MTVMAVNHTCGHAAEYDLRGPESKRHLEAQFLAEIPCPRCPRLDFAAPELQGATGQPAIATPIRNARIGEIRAKLVKEIDGSWTGSRTANLARSQHHTPNILKWATLWAALYRQTDATWWIRTRSFGLPELITLAMRDKLLPPDFRDE